MSEERITIKMPDENNKDDLPLGWKKAKVFSEILFSILLPAVVASVGLLLNSSISREEVKIKYINIATGILEKPPSDKNKEIRTWAVGIINHYAAVKMKEETKQEFIYGKPIPGKVWETDFTIFACPEKKSDSKPIIEKVIQELQGEETGEITPKIWDRDNELSREDRKGKFTIITDKNHGEKGELPRVRNALKNADESLPIKEIDNLTDPTPWRISIVVCPN